MSNHPVRQALCKSFTSLLDWPTLVAVLLGGAIALGVHRAPSDLASTVFTANATFVALIVPAAALANTLLEGRLISYVEQLSKLATSTGAAKEGAGKAATTLSELADRVVGATAPVVRGFVFLLVSFGLSIGALFHPNHHIWRGAGSFKVRPADLLIGEALGATAAKNLLSVNDSMASLRGRFYDYSPPGIVDESDEALQCKLVVTYHPAFLLRDPRQKKEAWKDLQMVMRHLNLPTPQRAPSDEGS